jgi:hypothetical protein
MQSSHGRGSWTGSRRKDQSRERGHTSTYVSGIVMSVRSLDEARQASLVDTIIGQVKSVREGSEVGRAQLSDNVLAGITVTLVDSPPLARLLDEFWASSLPRSEPASSATVASKWITSAEAGEKVSVYCFFFFLYPRYFVIIIKSSTYSAAMISDVDNTVFLSLQSKL